MSDCNFLPMQTPRINANDEINTPKQWKWLSFIASLQSTSNVHMYASTLFSILAFSYYCIYFLPSLVFSLILSLLRWFFSACLLFHFGFLSLETGFVRDILFVTLPQRGFFFSTNQQISKRSNEFFKNRIKKNYEKANMHKTTLFH